MMGNLKYFDALVSLLSNLQFLFLSKCLASALKGNKELRFNIGQTYKNAA